MWRLEKNKAFQLLVLIIITVLGFIVRGYNLFVPVADWHSFRQADTISVSRVFLEEGVDLLRPRYHDISNTQSGLFNPNGYRMVEFPFYNLLITYFYQLFPIFSLEAWGRIVSILTTLLTAYFVFLLTKNFVNYKYGLLASFVYLVIPFNIYFTRVILPEPTALMLSMASLWLFAGHCDKDNIMDLFSSGVFMSLAILVKPYVFFYTIPMLYLLVKKTGIKEMFKLKYMIFLLVIIVPFLLWRIWIGQFPEGIPFWKWTLNGDGIRFKPAFFRWLFSERIGKLILGVWGVFIFVIGLSGKNKSSRFFQTLMLGVLVYLSVFATANVRHDYYQTIIVPAIVMIFTFGFFIFWEKINLNKSFKLMSFVATLFLMIITAVGFIKEYYKINHPEIIKAGLAVQKVVPEDALVIAPYNGDTAFLYQTRRKGWPVVDFPIEELIGRGAKYFVSVDLGHYQTVEFSEKYEIIEKTDQYVILKLS